jgi:acylphosphatase
MTGPDLNTRIETYYVHVRGVVQGVGFRHATVRRAHELAITGWVSNLADGSV